MAARLESHPLEQAPGRGLPGTQRLGLAAQRQQPIGELVANAFERAEVQQPGGSSGRSGPRDGQVGELGAHGGAELRLERGDLVAEVAARPGLVGLRKGRDLRCRSELVMAFERGHGQPPIGARGLAPQKSWVPSMPMRWTTTMLSTIDFAVAVPTPTGPPPAL